MSDHIEHACWNCGSLLHHKDQCDRSARPSTAAPAPAAPAANAELVREIKNEIGHNYILGTKAESLLHRAAAALSAQGVDEARTILEVLVGLKQIKRQMENGTALAVDIEVYESTKEEIWKQAEALFPNLCQPTGAARLAEKP